MRADLLTPIIIERKLGPISQWSHSCHAASLALVRSGLIDECRVARGACMGVGGQHSWVVEGMDVYDEEATIVDLTWWSYDDSRSPLTIVRNDMTTHRPHFMGSLWEWGCPETGMGEEIVLTPEKPLSDGAQQWLDMARRIADGPLDRRFWQMLMSTAPVGGWPNDEITLAAYQTPGLKALIPIDRVGMCTDVNPGGLYLPEEEEGAAGPSPPCS